MENIKTNDWLATLVKHPDMNLVDLRRNGITADNTAMKSRDEYKKMEAVRNAEVFLDSNTKKFDENRFNKYYDSALALYNKYATDDSIGKTADFLYSTDAYWAPQGAPKFDISPSISLSNPGKAYNQGISYISAIDQPTENLSVREIAQTQEVVDYKTGKSLGWKPNDNAGSISGFFRSCTAPTVVLAQWDSDGTHTDEYGNSVHHSKGEVKLRNGNPYYETLGDRSAAGKDVLRVSDTLTEDGSWANKHLDFLDSDDVHKSVGKTAAKTAASIGLLFVPYVGEAYGYASMAMALSRAMPSVLKSIDAAAFGTTENKAGKAFNVWESYMTRYDQTASDYGREHLVSFEGLGNLVSSITGQLYQQKAIAKLGLMMTKSPELARDLSFGYMAATSSQDNYDAFKEAGLSDRAAGISMLASMGALYGLMNNDYFRNNNTAFVGTVMDESKTLAPSKKLFKEIAEDIRKYAKEADTKPLDFYTKLKTKYSKRFVEGLTSSDFINRSLAEGIEEMMEETVVDLTKVTNMGLDALGMKVTEEGKDLDFGLTGKDILSRYSMNFLGGAIGGGIFYGQGKWSEYVANGFQKKVPLDIRQELTYEIAQGHAQEIRDLLNK